MITLAILFLASIYVEAEGAFPNVNFWGALAVVTLIVLDAGMVYEIIKSKVR